MNIKDYIKSPAFKGVIVGILICVVALIIFEAGVSVGYHKSTFEHRFGNNYYRAFGDRSGKFGLPLREDLNSAHGAVGKVVSISLPTVVVADLNNVEKIVSIGSTTLIRRLNTEISAKDIKVDDFIVVLGEPDDNSQIKAKLIRILPSPPESGPGTGGKGGLMM